ncbi:SDR family oxidoreductase [Phenylobacterium sp.]|uniref:SDR family oxidoreductase n=1 Tax=Phenylobacterium sp. TaxID=1871053 RepID=UPI00122B2AD8|nr:SDR family oxidoreductase [Phenylobacterium sp.]THD61526.1 MAG: SDR family oxidoreductase [Phenylobacterium sp.]
MAKLDGAKVVVIGGASGVGFAVAAAAMEAGAEVFVGSSQAPRIEAAAEKLGQIANGKGAKGRTVDVKDEASVAGFFEAAGPFDHLVFTAGDWGHMFGPTRDLDVEASKARMEVRFWGAARAAKHATRQIAKDGSITLTGGMLAHRPMPGMPLVTASANTTEGLALGLARDLAPIRVNAVCLGLIISEQVQTMGEATIKGFTANLPLPRGGTVEEAAEAYLYLMRATYVTGQVVRVDGGGSLV